MKIGFVMVLGLLGSVVAASSWAQQPDQSESLCNPCVDPPVRPIRRNNFDTIDATTVVTAEDMRELGVISAEDMINRLPSRAGATENVRFNLDASMRALREQAADAAEEPAESDSAVDAEEKAEESAE